MFSMNVGCFFFYVGFFLGKELFFLENLEFLGFIL